MDEQFQLNLLCYIVQSPNGVSYIDSINEENFDFLEFKLATQVLKRYHKINNGIPGELQAKAFLEQEIKNTPDMSEGVADDIREVFEDIYLPMEERNRQYIEDKLIISLQEKQLEVVSSQFAKGEITPDDFFKKLAPISALAIPGDESIFNSSGFIVADRDKHLDEQIKGEPTFLHDLNRLTAAGGFYSPQFIIFMSGPKYFKTGLLINLAVNYARDGYSVYYADGENGARSIRNRMKQSILGCQLSELYDGTIPDQEIEDALRLFGFYMGGDIFVDSYPASTKSVKDVENRLAYLKVTYQFVPDLIVWDSSDHFIPSKPEDQKRDTRIQIQKVYHEIIALNSKLGCFSLGPSQINRGGISKKVLDMKDISEDFGKVMNAHAVFAICATDEEMEEGIRRIVPVAQREGVGYRGKNQCLVKVDEATMQVYEAEDENKLTDVDDA